jgi:hypothetical protein
MTHTTQVRELLTRDEVATRLRLGVEKVDRLVATKQLTPILICGEMRFDSADVVTLIMTYKAVAERRN